MQLSRRQRCLLLEVLSRSAPELIDAFYRAVPDNVERRELLMKLLKYVTAELCASGLGDDSEPNERGLLLEDLIWALSLEAQTLV